MKKKKLMALLLAGMLGVSALAGCGDSSDDSSKGSDADNSTGMMRTRVTTQKKKTLVMRTAVAVPTNLLHSNGFR